MMRLVLDLDVAQTASQSLSAGFVLALAKQLSVAIPKNAELIVVLSGEFPGTIESLRGEFQNLMSQSQIRVWYPPIETFTDAQVSDGMRRVEERLHQAFIDEMRPDLVVLTSLMDGLSSCRGASVGYLCYSAATAVFLPIQGELGQAEGVRLAWQWQHPLQVDRDSYILEVPGLTSFPDVLETLKGWSLVRLPDWGLSEYDVSTAARRLWEIVELEHASRAKKQLLKHEGRRLRLAYVSPLPPEQTGIGYYSAELLPELSNYFDIDVVLNQPGIPEESITAHHNIRSVAWFESHGHEYDRVVYQFGNSRFHTHMWDLIERIPGVAVMHDFYLGDAMAYREDCMGVGLALAKELYYSHGYAALKPLLQGDSRPQAIRQFPCSYSPIREAKGVIVHSRHAQELSAKWYGDEVANRIQVIPHLRKLPKVSLKLRRQARERLNIAQDAFLIGSFGVVNRTKLPDRLISAWHSVQFRQDSNAQLVFVGATPDEYCRKLMQHVDASEYKSNINFTGWADSSVFLDYLAAVDVAVQLRSDTRGETSGTVLDCMAHGIATICNAHGSFAEVPKNGVWMLDDRFTDDALVDALDTLWRDAGRRKEVGQSARQQIERHYSPAFCAERYFQAIERSYLVPSRQRLEVVKTAIEVLPKGALNEHLAANIGITLPLRPPQKQLLVDVTVIAREDLRTGVQRVVRSILSQLLEADLPGVRVEPVYTNPGAEGYFYAREFTQHFMGGDATILPDEPVEAHCGDIILGLDLHTDGIKAQQNYLEKLRDRGVKVFFVVHDLLPITHPQWFPLPEEQAFENWLHSITSFDGAICVSKTTADELEKWMINRSVQRHRPYYLGVAHNGADIRQSMPNMGLPIDAEEVLAKLRSKPSFLMVGTIEPRKGVAQVLAAFELLWCQGQDINLVLVGKQGWNVAPVAERLEQHAESNIRLFWLRGISDEYLERVYADSTCLISASEGEGFGLPLIEAAQHAIPILARDIPVFREVAGVYADYFSAESAEQLAAAVVLWQEKYAKNRHIKSDEMTFLTWADSARKYLEHLLG